MLHIFSDSKFKTASITIYSCMPLTRETATVNALLPKVIERSSTKYPTTLELKRKLSELYDAEMLTATAKKGDWQQIIFRWSFLSDNFADEYMLQGMTDLVKDIVFERNDFNKEYVRQEKENLKMAIAALLNDKRTFAHRRLTEIMFENQPYGVCEEGYLSEVDKIEDLTQSYNNMLLAPIDIFVMGNVDSARVESAFKDLPQSPSPIVVDDKNHFDDDFKYVKEVEQVAQSKLSMGFSTNITARSDGCYPLVVFNSIFGGGAHSKLFNNVREKLSLAYYAGSKVDRFKGAVFVDAGVDGDNCNKAEEEIIKQLEAITKGEVSDIEMNSAKLAIVRSLNERKDSQTSLENFYSMQFLSGRGNESLEEAIESIKKVTKEQVVSAANTIQYKAKYVLGNKL